MSNFARPELLATTEWLSENLSRPEIRVLDVRWRPDGTARQAYAAGHVPGASFLDWSADLVDRDDDDGVILLAGPERVAAAMARAGVGDGTTVVIYDDTVGLYAARVWWSLRVYGFDSARILDGGMPAWLAESRPLSNADVPPPPAFFTPRAQPRLRLTTADVRALLGSGNSVLIDARAPAEYRGLEGSTRRLGHIPGAVNMPAGILVEPGSQRLRDAATLRSLFHRANVARGRRIVCYDAAGIAAARVAFVLTLLGHDDVAVYDGGWSEWGDRLDLPVDR
jgi:thiosulfate/3-mercaptopyruvate sulfurtransferase